MRYARKGEAQKFLREVVFTYEGDDCLPWPFAKDHNGYGRISGRMVSRRVCEHENGPPPTRKHEAAHSCGNGDEACCNKRHLSWKTPVENAADKLLHGTHLRGEANGKTKLTEDAVKKIRALKGRTIQLEIAAMFGISRTAVSMIHRGKTWSWLHEGEAA